MDVVLLMIAISLAILLVICIWFFFGKGSKKTKQEQGAAPRGPVARRAVGVRGANVRQRRPNRPVAEEHHDEASDGEGDEARAGELGDLSKLGAKKRAKLEAKAERKVQREIEERDREERKKREQREQEERDKASAKEREEERRREEAEKAELEERKRKEYEEYLKLKEAFSVEEEGFSGSPEGEEQSLLAEFVEHVKSSKVVVLEDLAQRFGLKTQHAIDRVKQMQEDGILSGVIDDRGKFIYISKQELEAVAKFVRQRGRVSIAELAEHSNSLINLNPGATLVEA
ncbi:hypothetical protein QAD02_015467 [Eretmocerus hayati]|uniref:Uncharacterized protein n=1 Tax=Eretmocerus hayati TaxID=131215 RepID=A0ACC2PD36_9HYME|nr:hypothetical protein QAD02_015467 [Eretmocerus hayati]